MNAGDCLDKRGFSVCDMSDCSDIDGCLSTNDLKMNECKSWLKDWPTSSVIGVNSSGFNLLKSCFNSQLCGASFCPFFSEK
jgi:hypothetical protein